MTPIQALNYVGTAIALASLLASLWILWEAKKHLDKAKTPQGNPEKVCTTCGISLEDDLKGSRNILKAQESFRETVKTEIGYHKKWFKGTEE
jgi:hypothetical protein